MKLLPLLGLGLGLLGQPVHGQQPGKGPARTETTTIEIAPSDARIRYTGRWERANPDQPWAGWQGSSLLIRFQGTSISAVLDSGIYTEYFRVVVDGDLMGSTKMNVAPAIFGSPATYTLASGLSDAVHVVEFIKETYAGTEATFYGFQIEGTRVLPPPPAPPRRIEFYGDSNLAGHSLEDERNLSGTIHIGTTFGYAGIVSRMFDAEYHNISASGETISSLHNRYDRYEWGMANPKWDFDLFPADLVVVNLGANDVGKPKGVIKNHYHALLDDLRVAHPTAHIMLYNAFGWDFDEPAGYIDEVIAERADPDMSWAVFPWVFEQWHGCEYDHGGMAAVLASHISSVLGWAPAPADVMSGYGQSGDLANGGFEQTAPFGGFGWRYFTDPGVNRILDPAAAFEGDRFVQLRNQGEIHQPNPASAGDTVSVTLWLRGASPGDTVDVTIDFRDQEMYTTPLKTKTTTLNLGTAWQTYQVSDVAPLGGTPVFHTRLTIRARPGAQVDVDGLSMTVQ